MTEPTWSLADHEHFLSEMESGAVFPGDHLGWKRGIIAERTRILAGLEGRDVPDYVRRWLVRLIAEGRKP